ncbi:uncharacterized [Tachysurus ichikawai]
MGHHLAQFNPPASPPPAFSGGFSVAWSSLLQYDAEHAVAIEVLAWEETALFEDHQAQSRKCGRRARTLSFSVIPSSAPLELILLSSQSEGQGW